MIDSRRKAEEATASRPPLLRWLVVAFVVSMVFDWVSVPILRSTVTPSRLLGIAVLVLFLLLAPSFRPRLRWYGGDLKWFCAFLLVASAEEIYRVLATADVAYGLTAYFTYVQVFAMFFILRDVTRDTRVYKGVLGAFALTYVSAAVLTLLGVPLVTATGGELRMGLAGSNLNMLAFLYAAITVCIASWLFANKKVLSLKGGAAVAAAALLVVAIAKTGSRGGALALAAGLVVTTVVNIRANRIPKYLVLLPVIVGGVAFFLSREEVFVTRMTATIIEGDSSGREEIADVAIRLARERPLTGYGPAHFVDLGNALGLGRPIAAHNTYLQVLLSFGLLGFIPFILGVGSLLRSVWKHHRSVWGSMWLGVLAMTLVFGMVGHFADAKYFWIILALAANAGVMAAPARRWAPVQVVRGESLHAGRQVRSRRPAGLTVNCERLRPLRVPRPPQGFRPLSRSVEAS